LLRIERPLAAVVSILRGLAKSDFTFLEPGYESEEAYQQALEEERRNQT
jgi:hypothetical protein